MARGQRSRLSKSSSNRERIWEGHDLLDCGTDCCVLLDELVQQAVMPHSLCPRPLGYALLQSFEDPNVLEHEPLIHTSVPAASIDSARWWDRCCSTGRDGLSSSSFTAPCSSILTMLQTGEVWRLFQLCHFTGVLKGLSAS